MNNNEFIMQKCSPPIELTTTI